MASIEQIGEKMLRLMERVYLFILDLLIKVALLSRGVIEKIERLDREKLYPFFEKRDIDLRDYAIFKLEIASVVFLILSVLFIIDSISGLRYAVSGGVLIVFIFYVMFSSVKRNFEEFNAYRDFFFSYLALALFLALIKLKKPVIGSRFPFLHFIVIAVLGGAVISIYFRRKYSRDFTYGRVIEAGVHAKVKFNYDICSDIKPQIGTLRNTMNAREDDIVKVSVRRSFLSLRGSTPVEIIGVEWS